MNQIFNFQNQSVRIEFKNGEPLFCLTDVAEILLIKNANPTRFNLKKDGVHKMYTTDTMGREKEITYINEPNLYRVIFRSNKPEAVKFQDWIFEEVIPQIRATGSYTVKVSTQQKQQIQAAVNRRVHRTGETHQAIYTAIHELAQVASYHDIAATDFDNVMNFINGEKVSGSLNKPLPQEYFTHLAKMTRYAGKLWQFQNLMCQSPNSEKAKTMLNELVYSTNINETGFLFIFKPNLKADIQQAVDWLHAQSQVI